jgi:hypothetical protein
MNSAASGPIPTSTACSTAAATMPAGTQRFTGAGNAETELRKLPAVMRAFTGTGTFVGSSRQTVKSPYVRSSGAAARRTATADLRVCLATGGRM